MFAVMTERSRTLSIATFLRAARYLGLVGLLHTRDVASRAFQQACAKAGTATAMDLTAFAATVAALIELGVGADADVVRHFPSPPARLSAVLAFNGLADVPTLKRDLAEFDPSASGRRATELFAQSLFDDSPPASAADTLGDEIDDDGADLDDQDADES